MIVAVSDTAVGYSTPQIPVFAKALADYFGEAGAIIYEPDNALRPRSESRWREFPGIAVTRVPTANNFYSFEGRGEFCDRVAAALNETRPDVVVIANIFIAQVLLHLDYRPKTVIFQSLELIGAYSDFDHRVAKRITQEGMVDLIIFPEANRLAADMELMGWPTVPTVLMYNSCNSTTSVDHIIAPSDRLGKVCFTGNFGEESLSEWFKHPALKDVPMDWYGWFSDARLAAELPRNITYFGALLPSRTQEVRAQYAYSLVLWNPNFANQYWACPNKFFESLACGVPVIVTPHPQCEGFVKKYGCGWVLDEFSPQSLSRVMHQALDAFESCETAVYQEMVEGCRRAVREELNFEVQFGKVKEWLDGRQIHGA